MTRLKSLGMAVAVGALLCMTAQTAVSASSPRTGSTENPLVTRGCAVRLEDSGPYLLANSTHFCTGFSHVRYVNGWLEVTSDSKLPVVSIAVSPDESLVARGILAGASGGGKRTVIRFYSTRTQRIMPAESSEIHCRTCNVWVTITSFAK
jgi:hypothetical protein